MATTVSQPGYYNLQALTDLGALAVGGRLYTYVQGTTTHKVAYTDSAGTTPHTYSTDDGGITQYIALNARGELPAPLYLTTGAYDIALKTSAGATVWTRRADPVADAGAFLQSGTGAVSRTVQAKLRESVSVQDFGAVADGATNATPAFSAASAASSEVHVSGGAFSLSTNPTGTSTYFIHDGATLTGAGVLPATCPVIKHGPYIDSWVDSVSASAYEYLEANAGYNVQAKADGIGLFAPVRSSRGSGLTGAVSIGVAAFAYNDYTAGSSDVFGYYATTIRKSGNLGSTHGMEIDVANMGATVVLYPNAPFVAGQTDAMWLCTGGETATASTVGAASLALGIIRNDGNASPSATFEKGILFHSTAINGTDGATGNGIAIAFATRHQQLWYNNSNQVCGEIVVNNTTFASAMRLDISSTGLLVQDRATGGNSLQVERVTSAANYVTITGAVAAGTPAITMNGSDTNIDFYLAPKGSGNVRFGTYTGGAVAQAGYITIKDNGGTTRRLLVG